MQEQTTQPLTELARQFSAYLPTFAAGFLVLALGVAVGWLVKRTVVRLLRWLRLDRLAGRSGWRTALGKGDVRAALYNVVGSIGMGLVILLFADDALRRWGLEAPSRFIAAVLGFLPNLSLGTVIVLAGVIIANALGARVETALREEGLTRARLLARTFKGTLLFVVGALAMWELQFAREIVLGGFLVAFGSLGVAFAMAVGLGSAKAIQQGWETMFARRRSSTGSP